MMKRRLHKLAPLLAAALALPGSAFGSWRCPDGRPCATQPAPAAVCAMDATMPDCCVAPAAPPTCDHAVSARGASESQTVGAPRPCVYVTEDGRDSQAARIVPVVPVFASPALVGETLAAPQVALRSERLPQPVMARAPPAVARSLAPRAPPSA